MVKEIKKLMQKEQILYFPLRPTPGGFLSQKKKKKNSSLKRA
jgi:hypothetical protein